MTLADVLRAMLRRWPVVLGGVLLTLIGMFLATRSEPVYSARTEMVFLAPSSTRYPNELVTQTESLIVTAGAVAKRINGADVELQFGKSTVNPVGAPATGNDTWIHLLDIGTQWVSIFDDQVLVVDAVGATPDEVRERIQAASDLIQENLRQLQVDQNVDPSAYITATMSPAEPVVLEVKGSILRAVGMTGALGLFLTAALIVVLETRSRTSRARTPESWPGMLASMADRVER
jgi:hypothetical protein